MNNLEQNLLVQKPTYFGVIVTVLIIILMAILVGLYAWSEQLILNKNTPQLTPLSRPTAAENNEPESTSIEAQVETLGALSTSDELSAIESDLESTPFEEEVFDASLVNIEAELAR